MPIRCVTVMVMALLWASVVRADDLVAADTAWYHGDWGAAAKLYQSAALRGDRIAQRRLGAIYVVGIAATGPDFAEALKWYHLAALQGDAEAADSLALLYRDGAGVPQDFPEALKWLHLAAAKRFELAQYHLGLMYRDGVGVPQDKEAALMWLSLATKSGAAQIAAARDELAQTMTKAQQDEAQRRATSCQLRNFRACD